MNEDITQLGFGVIPDTIDGRDYQYSSIAGASLPVDWSQEFRLQEPPNEHQGSSDSCVAQSVSYLHRKLKGKDYSRRDLFSRIALDYGAYLRDGVRQICKTGQQTRDECPDPFPQTRQNMRVKSSLPDSAGMDDLESSYTSVPNNVEMIAKAVRDQGGCIFGVTGNWTTWTDLTNPEPPSPNTENWQHAIYAFGFHLHNGEKCIIAKSSWCTPTHKEHHIRENYFKAGMTFSAWTVVPKNTENMTNSLVVKRGGEYGLYMPATSPDGLITLFRLVGIQPPLNEDGTLDWVRVETMVQGQVV